MGRHRNDPRGLARIVIIGAAVTLVMALVVVGGMALVSSLNSEAATPDMSVSPSSEQQSAAAVQEKTIYAKIEVIGPKVEIYAAAPGNTKVYWDAVYTKGEVRDILWKDVDLTISDSSAVRISVRGERFALPKKKDLGLQVVDGELSIIG